MPIPTLSFIEQFCLVLCEDSQRCPYAGIRFIHPGTDSPPVAMCNRAKVPISELRVCPIGHWRSPEGPGGLPASKARFVLQRHDRKIHQIETAIWRIEGTITNLDLLTRSAGQGPPAWYPEPDTATVKYFVELQIRDEPLKESAEPWPEPKELWTAVPGDRDSCCRAIALHEAALPVLSDMLRAEAAAEADLLEFERA
jgi:hypothetical protein